MTGQVVCFGEAILRLSTIPGRMIGQSGAFDVFTGGAEANVAVAMASLGQPARFVSLLPANPLGAKVRADLAAAGVDVAFLSEKAGRLGLYFLETGASLRPSAVTYDRAESVFSRARPDDFDLSGALRGAGLLHVSGITAALGPGGAALVGAAIAAAKSAGATISLDCNYRPGLWGAWESDPRRTMTELVAQADILFGNHRDIALLFDRPFSGDGPERRREAAQAAFDAFPNLSLMASTARTPLTQTHHQIAARVDTRDGMHQTPAIDVTDIVDRVGTGDAFAAGVLLGWIEGRTIEQVADMGLRLAILKHSLVGDFCTANRAALDGFSTRAGDLQR
jgi:2-dehydro-3-deoxygluconokinase